MIIPYKLTYALLIVYDVIVTINYIIFNKSTSPMSDVFPIPLWSGLKC